MEAEDRSIPFRGTLTFAQYREARALHQGRGMRLLRWIVIAAFTLFALGAVAIQYWHGESLQPALLLLLVPSILLVLVGLAEWNVRKSWTTHKLLRAELQGRLADDAFAIESPYGSSRVPWDQLYQWTASPTLLMVYQSSSLFHLLPRAFFATGADWGSARELVAAKLPSLEKKRRRVRIVRTVFWLLMLAALVYLFFEVWRT